MIQYTNTQKQQIKSIVDQYANDIEAEAFQNIFDELNKDDQRLFYAFLVTNCDINPLDYLTSLPEAICSENLTWDNKNLEEAFKIIKIPEGIKSLEDGLFYNNHSIEHIMLPNSIETIGDSCFSGCDNLIKINIPTNPKLKTLPASCFRNCKKLEELFIPDNIINIDLDCFYACNDIKLSWNKRDGVNLLKIKCKRINQEFMKQHKK